MTTILKIDIIFIYSNIYVVIIFRLKLLLLYNLITTTLRSVIKMAHNIIKVQDLSLKWRTT